MFHQKPHGIDDIWSQLESGINQILKSKTFPKMEWMNRYTDVYNHCTNQKGADSTSRSLNQASGAIFQGKELYTRLSNLLRDYVGKLQKDAENYRDESLLTYYRNEWESYTMSTGKTNHIFSYLNRHWIKREIDDGKQVYEVNKLALVIWRDHMYVALKDRLLDALLSEITRDRDGEQINAGLLSSITKSLVSLGLNVNEKGIEQQLEIYQAYFEGEFVSATQRYYASESSKFISLNNISDYLKKAESRLEEEEHRVKTYLHHSTLTKLIETCQTEMIEKHKEIIWNEFQVFLQEDKFDDLKRAYSLLVRIPNGLDPIRSVFEKHIQTIGLETIERCAQASLKDPRLYVEEILKVYKKFYDMVSGAFNLDTGFISSLDRASRKFVNENAVTREAKSASKSPELLARFSDQILKKSPKNPEESEIDSLLGDVMTIFKFIEEKDVFMTFYSKSLAKRLIHSTSVSEDMEGAMIGKLKQACGYEFTSKLQRMFTDISLSRDMNEKFKQRVVGKGLTVDFSMLILATGCWPLSLPNTNFSIPRDLQKAERSFQEFYASEHCGRKLNWLHQLSKGEIKMNNIPSSKVGYTFQCSTYQMGVLLQFNDSEKNTYENLQNGTQLNDSVLGNTLKTLLKTKILVPLDSSRDESSPLTKSDVFVLNKGFKSKRMKVNINVRIEQEQQVEVDETQVHLEEHRKLQIQAAIVRVMKARKQLDHANLMGEIVSQLQSLFKPKIVTIKKCIDVLIEKEYLERVEGHKDVYSYMA
eukprot:TRINITY_DN12410_c0_g1_i1.p1 TRINITY_DN12410_c0_g1~~TRINITY_DN12410_c0_g1_i1.p1  ORF type:complete len:768 (+),score=286.72 TRINITY_DN12410_c0_g1_i1:26-2305(+)